VARRDVSNTPLQALTLMNDPMLVELADRLGETIAIGDGDFRTKLVRLFRRVLTRPPTGDELASLSVFQKTQEERGGDARKAWAAVARALLSLDETITRN
jgi:hypothetical protein